MVDKIVKKVVETRKNWYEAFRLGVNIKGYEYYKSPGEIKYRNPAPGSVALDEVSQPHLFKKHWKMPFRESPYNIRRKEKRTTQDANTDHFISGFVTFDPVT